MTLVSAAIVRESARGQKPRGGSLSPDATNFGLVRSTSRIISGNACNSAGRVSPFIPRQIKCGYGLVAAKNIPK
jgi:hypothetical protein